MFPDSLDVQPEKLLIPEYVENDEEKIELGQKLYTAKIDQYGTIYMRNVGFAKEANYAMERRKESRKN